MNAKEEMDRADRVFDALWKEYHKDKPKMKMTKCYSFHIDFNSDWYKNCKRNRKNKAKICNSCPFINIIKEKENE